MPRPKQVVNLFFLYKKVTRVVPRALGKFKQRVKNQRTRKTLRLKKLLIIIIITRIIVRIEASQANRAMSPVGKPRNILVCVVEYLKAKLLIHQPVLSIPLLLRRIR